MEIRSGNRFGHLTVLCLRAPSYRTSRTFTSFGFKNDVISSIKHQGIELIPASANTGETPLKMAELKSSLKLAKSRIKFVLATDGDMIEAQDSPKANTLRPRSTN